MDQNRYKKEVLTTWSKDTVALSSLQAAVLALQGDARSKAYRDLDLVNLFDVPANISAAELKQHSDDLSKVLDKSAKMYPAAVQVKTLKTLLEKSGDFTSPAFWADVAKDADRIRQKRLASAVEDLRAEAPLGVMSAQEFERRSKALGVADADTATLKAALAEADVRVYDTFEIPALSPALAPIDGMWKAATKHAEYRTIVDVYTLENDARTQVVTVVDSLSADGVPVTLAQVKNSLTRANARSDTAANADAKKLLGQLVKADSDEALRNIAVITLLSGVTESLAAGLPANRVMHQLREAGIARFDAQRLVDVVTEGGSVAPAVPDLDSVRLSLANGQLQTARRILSALSAGDSPGERAQVEELLKAAEARKDAAIAGYRTALAEGEFLSAQSMIHTAMSIDSEDPQLAELLNQIPPSPPEPRGRRVSDHVELTWPSGGQDVTYTIRRGKVGAGHSPVLAVVEDLNVVATGITTCEWVDERPLVGERAVYQVTATRLSGAESKPGQVEITLLPEPTHLEAKATETAVDLTWHATPAASDYLIQEVSASGIRDIGEVRGQGTFHIDGLQVGVTYRFLVTARYVGASGLLSSSSVAISCSPQARPRQIMDLHLETGEEWEGGQVVAWTCTPGYASQLWYTQGKHELSLQSTPTQEDLEALGFTRLVNHPASNASHCRGQLPASLELGELYPMLATQGRYLVGSPIPVGSPPKISGIQVEPLSDALRLTWEWPSTECIAEVMWMTAQPGEQMRPMVRRFTKSRYWQDGAVYVPDPRSVHDIQVKTVVKNGGEELVSAPERVAYAPPRQIRPVVSYRMAIQKSRLRTPAQLRLTLNSDGVMQAPLRLGVFLATSDRMPQTPSGCTCVLEFDYSGGPHEMSVDLGRIKGNFWVRLFPHEPGSVEIVDPPTSQMKG